MGTPVELAPREVHLYGRRVGAKFAPVPLRDRQTLAIAALLAEEDVCFN